jgi:hypothetical protein
MIPYDKDDILKPVIIESNVWIGLGVSLCPGAKIGEGSILVWVLLCEVIYHLVRLLLGIQEK